MQAALSEPSRDRSARMAAAPCAKSNRAMRSLSITACATLAVLAAGMPSPAAADDLEAEIIEIAEALREDFGNAVRWKPTNPQINAISHKLRDAEWLRAYVELTYRNLPTGQSAAKPGQTEITVIGPDLGELPGGYRQQIDHFRPGTAIYGFRYTEPGKDVGMRYDGLFRVDGKWFLIPKAWRAFGK